MTPEKVLKQYFGYDNFRLNQKEVIETCLQGKDSLVIMPTGGGKSICYQIPALLLDGVTIVVSPLIALMKDQVDSLKANGVAAEFLNSSLTYPYQKMILENVRAGKIKILYVAPERIAEEGSLASITGNIKVSLIAIDEAHCISHWGHDFRPDYLVLGSLKKQYPDVPVMALTASADKITRDDIVKQLKLTGDNRFISSFNRPNISYFIHPKEQFDIFIPTYLDKHKDLSGIIYCLSRKSTEELAERLKAAGYNAASYHAGLEKNQRIKIQEDFIRDSITIIVATIAFGMGIDKSDVRFVIHADLPKNLESYYQETGRAGRDGMPSEAILFYSRSDVARLSYFISNEDPEHASIMHRKLDQMAEYAESHRCRRQVILNYFDEEHHGKCNSCDFCLTNYQEYDGTINAQMALSAIVRLQERYGFKVIIEFLRGSSSQRMTEQMRKIKTYGVGKDLSQEQWMDIIGQMINQKLIKVTGGQYPLLTVTDDGWKVLKGKSTVSFFKTISAIKTSTIGNVEQTDRALFDQLKQLRRLIADSENVPAYIVLSDYTIGELVKYLPLKVEELQYISGFGDYKIERYGAEFIQSINQYCAANNLSSRMFSNLQYKSLRKTPKKKFLEPKITSADLTLNLYKSGRPVVEIAQERGLSVGTIIHHLSQFLKSGEILITDLVEEKKIEPIREAIKINGVLSTATLKDYLGEDYDYPEIRAVVEYDRIQKSNVNV